MTGLLDDDGLLDLRRRAARTDPAAVIAEERAQAAAVPHANQSLLDWGTPTSATPAPAPSTTTGLCPLCNVRPARQRCNSCNRMVCPADVWTMLGLCKSCASAEDVAHWHRPAAPEADNWLGGKA